MGARHIVILLAFFLVDGSALGRQLTSSMDPPRPVPGAEDVAAAQAFGARVRDYVTLHRQLEAETPSLVPTTDVTQIALATHALAMRLQSARDCAAQGDIMSADVVPLFRRAIRASLSPDEWAVVFADIAEDDDEAQPGPAPELRVNMEWPDGLPYPFMPPHLLYLLPPLPSELQYRIVGRALVLWDHHANLIVDFVPAAFDSGT